MRRSIGECQARIPERFRHIGTKALSRFAVEDGREITIAPLMGGQGHRGTT